MRTLLQGIFTDRSKDLRRPLIGLYTILIAANLAAWAWAFALFHDHPLLLGTALLAYSFGLRHAVDADHIAAIDNVTRKLLQDGQPSRSASVSGSPIGHSAVVVLVSTRDRCRHGDRTCVAFRVDWKQHRGHRRHIHLDAVPVRHRRDKHRHPAPTSGRMLPRMCGAAVPLPGSGFRPAARTAEECWRGMFRPLFRLVTQSWHMLPLGFLFGLGFDTATEVALLGISATQAGQGMSIWSIMVFPALFAAGMSLVDTTDGVLMLGAYNWAFVKPMRKLFYNLVITAVSVVVAVVIGGIEGLGLIGDQLGLEGWFWNGIGALNDNLNGIGFIIIGVFVFAWVASLIIYRYARLDELAP